MQTQKDLDLSVLNKFHSFNVSMHIINRQKLKYVYL